MTAPRRHARLLRLSRWRVALLGALVVVAVLAALSAGAYTLARGEVYGRLEEHLERAALLNGALATTSGESLVVDERGRPLATLPPGAVRDADGDPFRIVPDRELGSLAVLRRPAGAPGPRIVATPAQDAVASLDAFLRVLLALTLAGGLAALPAGYVLAGMALRPLEEAVRERSEFVAFASHQLRTPLSVIRTSAELARGGQGVTADEALETILAQTRRMEVLAARLSALSRSEAAVAAAAGPADLAAAAAEAVAGLRPAAERAGVELRLTAAGPAWVRADAAELTDLVAVLVENAVQFSPRGRAVAVRVLREGGRAALEVADQGPGIDPEDVPRVTRPFFQGQRARGASGLGLAIAHSIAERRGTTVRVTLPTARD
jgi:signal transduction histidine kinase